MQPIQYGQVAEAVTTHLVILPGNYLHRIWWRKPWTWVPVRSNNAHSRSNSKCSVPVNLAWPDQYRSVWCWRRVIVIELEFSAVLHVVVQNIMLTLDVVPGRSAGAFFIGAPVNDMCEWLITNHSHVLAVDIRYDAKTPLTSDIDVNLVHDAVHLKFEPKSQRLRTIVFDDLTSVKLQCNHIDFSGPAVSPTFVLIYKLFGPAHPGEYDARNQRYVLRYPGMSIEFPIPSKFHSYCQSHVDIPPLEFPDGTTAVADRIELYGVHERAPNHIAPAATNDWYMQQVLVTPFSGIVLHERNVAIQFGTGVQDVLQSLGTPETVIYNPNESYFYNYRRFGFDVLFTSDTHRICKIVLHTNFPGNTAFGEYNKCNFAIKLGKKAVVTCDSTFDDVQTILGQAKDRPVVVEAPSSTNPYGPTLLYAYQGLVFEVLASKHIVSVCLFR
eukprot:TRINITY_DN2123_c0_g1_i13.p1 TRINITY_DN2123_c0_g1~~TRINITY_DN2123_c0_g1_i13.p1  ORF type:complete len:441 (+),score=50.16 TRINITY_DN2123_c0_g1_i13:1467-2789(+)